MLGIPFIFGRLLWGALPARWIATWRLLTILGVIMSIAAAALALAGTSMPEALLAVLSFVYGATANGWYGLYLAEVTRLAPAEHVARVTGAAIAFATAGVMAGPFLFGLVVAAAGYTLAFLLISLAAMLSVAVLLWPSSTPPSRSARSA